VFRRRTLSPSRPPEGRSDSVRRGRDDVPEFVDDLRSKPATLRSRGRGFGPARTDSARLSVFGLSGVSAAGLSDSGGGVGGKTLRLRGGSLCWRYLLLMSVRTRLEAAYEIFSSGRSSLAASGAFIFLISAPAKPVKASERSVAATRRALPR
jgi:hypothetical protein